MEILRTVLDSIGPYIELSDYPDILVYINSTINKLQQIGVGKYPFVVTKDGHETLDMFITDSWLNDVSNEARGIYSQMVMDYILASVKLRFDPPGTSYLIDLLKDELKEMEYRLMAAFDNYIQPQMEVANNA